MKFRKIRFGSMGVVNNGFDLAQYKPAFHPNNFSELNAHPRNWHIGKYEGDASYFNDNDPRFRGFIEECARTKITASELETINRKFEDDYRTVKEGYAESRGFFSDFCEAMAYSERQVRMGFNSTSGFIHPMAIVQCEHNATLRSSLGREYKISAHIWISGNDHEKSIYVYLYPQEEMTKENQGRFARFVMEHDWKKSGLSLEAATCTAIRGNEATEEIMWYDIRDPILDVSVRAISMSLGAFAIIGNPGNFESFCHKLIDQLDEFCVQKKVCRQIICS
ncbi:MAG: hypothetical protein WC788_07445 [Candidatus Paceibacterota bacterium]|jgi:hypothetical protein